MIICIFNALYYIKCVTFNLPRSKLCIAEVGPSCFKTKNSKVEVHSDDRYNCTPGEGYEHKCYRSLSTTYQYSTFPAAWAVVAGNTKLKATSSSSRERCCSQLTFQIRGRPATLCLRNLHSAALGSAVRQCATRTALVHEKCRVHESRNRNIGDFFRPSQSSIGPHATIFGLDFGA